MTTRFTGWHMLATMIAFFGVVIAVNVVMATDAIRTFGGTVVDNSYVATTRYNDWLGAARRQEREAWIATPSASPDGAVSVQLARAGRPVTGAAVTVIATHPVGLIAQRRLVLQSVGPGLYRSTATLPRGRWLIRITVRDTRADAAFEGELRV
jgi:nitrogen fixation protein FixH